MSEITSAAQARNNTVTLIDNSTGGYELPILEERPAPMSSTFANYTRTRVILPSTRDTSTGSCESSITYIDGEKACCSTVGIRSRNWQNI